MSDPSFELPSTLKRELRQVQRNIESIPALESHLTQIQKHGMSVRTAVSIESHFPGLLLPNAPSAYSYRSSSTNVEYSQEAIVDKIKGFRKTAGEMIVKLVQWIKDRCKVLGQTIKSGKIRQGLAKLAVLHEKGDRVNLQFVEAAMGDNATALFNNRNEVLGMGEIIGADITLREITSNLHVTNFDENRVGDALNKMLNYSEARIVLHPDTAKYILKPTIVTALRGFILATRGDSERARSLNSGMRGFIEKIQKVLDGKDYRFNYGELFTAVNKGNYTLDLLELVNDIEKAMSTFKSNDPENVNGLEPAVHNEQMELHKSLLTALAGVIRLINSTMTDLMTIVQFGTTLAAITSKETLTEYIRSGRI